MNITDPLEHMVADALRKSGIDFTHESQIGHPKTPNTKLDFHLTCYDVFIEVKCYHAERISKQMGAVDSVIALQGVEAVKLFCEILGEGGLKTL